MHSFSVDKLQITMPGQHHDRDTLFVAFDPFQIRPRHGRYARRPGTDVEQAHPPPHPVAPPSLLSRQSIFLTSHHWDPHSSAAYGYNDNLPQGQATPAVFDPPDPVIIHAPSSVPSGVHHETREASSSDSNSSLASLPEVIPESQRSSSHLSSRPSSSVPEQPSFGYNQPEASQPIGTPRGRPRSRSPSFLYDARRNARRTARSDNVVFADDLPYDEGTPAKIFKF